MGAEPKLGEHLATDLQVVMHRLCDLEDAVRVLMRSMAVLCIKHQVEIDAPDSDRPLAVLKNGKRDLILRTWEACHRNGRVAAGELGISPRMLHYELKKLGLTRRLNGRKPSGPPLEYRT